MPRLVEVGAFDCEHWSHSHPLIAQEGWMGLMFEPQPDMVRKCRECYLGYPVIIDECAIGSVNRDVKLYLLGSMSTIRRDMIQVFNDQGYGISADRFIIAHMHTLDERLEYHKWEPDFELLVVDVEGAEMEVFAGFTISKWMPKKCIIEACDPCPDPLLKEKTNEVRKYMKKNGYKETGKDGFDIIFERKDNV